MSRTCIIKTKIGTPPTSLMDSVNWMGPTPFGLGKNGARRVRFLQAMEKEKDHVTKRILLLGPTDLNIILGGTQLWDLGACIRRALT